VEIGKESREIASKKHGTPKLGMKADNKSVIIDLCFIAKSMWLQHYGLNLKKKHGDKNAQGRG
jgi:hypothetical protein